MCGSETVEISWFFLVGYLYRSISGSQGPTSESAHKSVTVRFRNTFRGLAFS